MSKPKLDLLPVELLYEIQLFALSRYLPLASRKLHQIFKSAPPSYVAEYIFLRTSTKPGHVYVKALRYPLCSLNVLQFIRILAEKHSVSLTPTELPRRLFTNLVPRKDGVPWNEQDHPLPFIRGLLAMGFNVNANSDGGYGLVKAVQSGFAPLVRFLLDNDASPGYKDDLAIRVAIRQKNLSMVKLLIERTDRDGSGSRSVNNRNKRRRLEDRVKVTKDMLKIAVKCKAQDIVEYLMNEKGCVPDMQTLYLMR
ncbi:hypothetical protein D9757_011630 [Collybiopsis confluens]|uniref:Ankyrin repeat protein n=1 Tax=Collybiopsis confluens TaxID=2823264 RepID=A0A8H5GWF7_9AGAR|nr:hypothetical protein D9757_014428 [Collybiopsis confluens]KAF5372408.1 hypothetical protein D9757_011630 [Collybiopsis confluens]